MRFCFRRLQLWSVLAGVLSLAAAPAYAQLFHRERRAPPPEFCPPAPTAAGPGNAPEFRVDFVEVTSYLEVAWNNRISGFIEVPIRSIELNDNHQDFGGLGDINAGFKAALIADPCSYLTFQFRVFTPT